MPFPYGTRRPEQGAKKRHAQRDRRSHAPYLWTRDPRTSQSRGQENNRAVPQAGLRFQLLARSEIDARAVGLGLDKKSVAAWDEDRVTMGVEAARQALIMAQVEASQVEAIYIGSESPPYAVKPSS